MNKEKNKNLDLKTVKAVNKNVRSSVRKLSPILKSIVGKKLAKRLETYHFLKKEYLKI